jgi:hypothetical protein
MVCYLGAAICLLVPAGDRCNGVGRAEGRGPQPPALADATIPSALAFSARALACLMASRLARLAASLFAVAAASSAAAFSSAYSTQTPSSHTTNSRKIANMVSE